MLPKPPLTDYRLFHYPLSNTQHPNLIRPLLNIPRADIEAYCAAHGLQPRFDRSNVDITYFRNWLRHEVIPLLEVHNPNLREVLRRSAEVMAGDYALLRSLLAETWPRVVVEEGAGIVFDLEAWRALPLGLQRSTLREAIHRLRRSLRNINFVHVEDAVRLAREGTTGQQATLPQCLMLTIGYGRLTIADADAPAALPDWPLLEPGAAPLPLCIPGETPLPGSGWVLRAELLDRAALPAGWQDNADPWQAYLDAQAVAGGLWLRTRQPGDRFQPLGLGGHTVKLSDFLTNQKVPHAARNQLPLLVGEGGILWVCGQRLDEHARVRDATGRALVLDFVRQP